jgi:hypothetical protein
MVELLAVLGVLALPVAVLTGVGERRRGGRWPAVALAVIAWPAAWTIWYVRDERRS